GTGKPRGLGRDAIPVLSQILAVSIAFDALLRNRTASASNNPDLLATHRLDDASGTQFDPDVVRALIRVAGSLS
ncbi:MAG: HD domain-containing phosphohydrolase, partial [Vulcanimicrobiaceae bacterium]